MKHQRGLFDIEERLLTLSGQGDPLEKYLGKFDYEKLRPLLNKHLYDPKNFISGRPEFDLVMMAKILLLQKMYNLSDHQTEYMINDRLSFMRFLKLEINEKVPDEKTIWLYHERF